MFCSSLAGMHQHSPLNCDPCTSLLRHFRVLNKIMRENIIDNDIDINLAQYQEISSYIKSTSQSLNYL